MATDLTEPPLKQGPAEYIHSTGLYDYNEATGLALKPMNASMRYTKIYRSRTAHFLNRVWKLLRPHAIARVTPTRLAPEIDTSQTEIQLNAFREMLITLKVTGATVEGVMTPNASWLETSNRISIRKKMFEICKEENIKVLDLSNVLTDQEFLDQDHLTYEGQQVTHHRIYPIIQPYLATQ